MSRHWLYELTINLLLYLALIGMGYGLGHLLDVARPFEWMALGILVGVLWTDIKPYP